MFKVSSFLMALAVFLTCVLTCSMSFLTVSAFSFSDFAIDSILSFFEESISSQLDSNSKLTEAARSYFFTYLTSNKYSYSGYIFSDDGLRFTDDYLEFCFDKYLSNAYYLSSPYDSGGDIFLSAAGFSNKRFNVSLIGFVYSQSNSLLTLCTSKDFPTQFSNFKAYYQSYLSRYLLSKGQEAEDPNPGKTGLEIAPGYVSGSDFKEALEKDNLAYTVKSPCLKMGYRNCEWFQSLQSTSSSMKSHFDNIPLIENYQFLTKTPDCYVLMYFYNGTDYYLSKYQFHFSLSSEDIYYEDRDEIQSTNYALSVEIWDNVNSDPSSLESDDKDPDVFDISSLPYCCFEVPQWSSIITPFKDRVSYVQGKYSNSLNLKNYDFGIVKTEELVSSDLSKSIVNTYYGPCAHFNGTYSDHDSKCSYKGHDDFGIFLSGTPIVTEYDLDIDKFPDDCVIEVNGGDTVYNYNITNPSTGQSSTVNEYVTNNYTYIEDSGGGQGSGGSVSGDVYVHGDVGVNGNIDVNVNVNQGSGTGIDPNDVITGDVDLGKYYDTAVEQTNGLNKFLAEFFSFLPNDILLLLGVTVAAAFICRLLGR